MKDYTNLVLSGGGMKGFVYIGFIKKLEELNILKKFKVLYGTSIGSLFCLLIILDYTSKEITNLLCNLDILSLIDASLETLIDTSINGLNNNKKIILFLEFILTYKNFDKNITLLELFNKTNKHFGCVLTKLPEFTECFFDHITNPNEKIVDTVFASMSIPIIFPKYKISNNYYIDGGFTNNFPLNYLFKSKNKY